MKKLILAILILMPLLVAGQSPEEIFHASAKLYIGEKNQEAKKSLDDGLRKYPNDRKLKELRDKIKEDEKKKQDQENKDKNENEQENKDQQNKEDQKEDQNKEDKEKQDQQKKDQEQKEKEKKQQEKQQQNEDQEKEQEKKENPQTSEKLKEMKISEEKARMVLEAMKNQEVQYLQQNKRKATKPKSKNKPDW